VANKRDACRGERAVTEPCRGERTRREETKPDLDAETTADRRGNDIEHRRLRARIVVTVNISHGYRTVDESTDTVWRPARRVARLVDEEVPEDVREDRSHDR